MRILVLANSGAGLYKFRKELLEALIKDSIVYLCLPRDEYTDHLKTIGCRFIDDQFLERRGMNPYQEFKVLRNYHRVLSDVKPDVVLTYTIKPNIYGGMACTKAGIPYISNVTGLGTTIENGGILAWVSQTLYRVGVKKARCVMFQNVRNKSFFEKKNIISGRTRLIPGSGVNLKTYYYEVYPESGKEIHILFVGRIMRDKGIEELLSVIRRIHSEHPEVVVDIVGPFEEDYNEKVTDAVNEGAVIYHGEQTEMHKFYKNCHCVVLPSYHEGMANVLLEASATGRPVIASNINGCKEAFDEGITGFGCEVKNVESLYNAMNRFIALPHEKRAEMGREARKKMEREFDRQIVIDAYLEEIEAILHSN